MSSGVIFFLAGLRKSPNRETARIRTSETSSCSRTAWQDPDDEVSTPVESKTIILFPGTDASQLIVAATLSDRFSAIEPAPGLSSLEFKSFNASRAASLSDVKS